MNKNIRRSWDFAVGEGRELLTNGDFTRWTGDNPDNWLVTETGDPASNITESIQGGECRIISDGTFTRIFQTLGLTIGDVILIELDVVDVTSGSIKITGNSATYKGSINAIGHYSFLATVDGVTVSIARDTPCDITIDNISIKKMVNIKL